MSTEFFRSRIWDDARALFNDFSGILVQVYDEHGHPLEDLPTSTPLCRFLSRYPLTSKECRNDCYRRLESAREGRNIISGRCYAGLSYRIVPVRSGGRPGVNILVGKVFTEIFGRQQLEAFAKRYSLNREDYYLVVNQVRQVSEKELDRIAGFMQKMVRHQFMVERKLTTRNGRAGLRKASSLIGGLWPSDETSSDAFTKPLDSLAAFLRVPNAALLVKGTNGNGLAEATAVGPESSELRRLAGHDWGLLYEVAADNREISFPNREATRTLGLTTDTVPLVVHRLTHGPDLLGYLLLLGGTVAASEGEMFALCRRFLSLGIYHWRCRQQWNLREQEEKLIEETGGGMMSAREVKEVLTTALDKAMEMLQAKRGSIFLAEPKEGRITDAALKGAHTGLRGELGKIPSDSVTHRVFYGNSPLLVRDTAREFASTQSREFPYSTKSFVSVPIRDNGTALGVFHLTERERDEVFTESDLSLLRRMGFLTAVAVQRLRLKEELADLKELSNTDPLLGICNRRYLENRLTEEVARAQRFEHPVSALVVDIDNFKDYNDELGHHKGDEILKAISTTLRENVRSIDNLSRFGGDEFVVLLPETGMAGAVSIAEKIRLKVMNERFPYEKQEDGRQITVSVGIATYPETATSPEELFDRADEALRQAKKIGKNRVLYWRS